MTALRQLLTVTAAFAALSLGQAHASDSVTINYKALDRLPPASAAKGAAVPKLIPPSLVRKHMAAVRPLGPSNAPSDGDTSVPPVFDSSHTLYNAVESGAGTASQSVARRAPAVGPAPTATPTQTATAAPPSTIAHATIARPSAAPAPSALPDNPPAIADAVPPLKNAGARTGERQMAMLTPAPAVTGMPSPVPAASAQAPRFTGSPLPPPATWNNAKNAGEVVFNSNGGAELIDLDPATLAKLDRLAQRICTDGRRVMLEAFGGARGDKSHQAHRIALRRGLAVRRYLIARGVPSSWIDILAVGGAKAGPLNRVDVMLASS